MGVYRDRLKEERRRRRNRALLRLFGLILFMAAAVAGWRHVHQPSFSFGDIAVHGTARISRADILRMSGAKEPINLFLLSKSRILTALRGDVRVEKAEAFYNFPGVLNVYINERKPVLYVRTDYGDYARLDGEGLVLELTDGIRDASVPRLSGVSCGNLFIGDRLNNDTIGEALKFLQKLPRDAREQISGLNVNEEKKLVLQMRMGFPVILGPVNELAGKAELFTTVFNEMKGKNVRAEYMDLQYSKPFIRLKQ